jgi:hypothetical protein
MCTYVLLLKQYTDRLLALLLKQVPSIKPPATTRRVKRSITRTGTTTTIHQPKATLTLKPPATTHGRNRSVTSTSTTTTHPDLKQVVVQGFASHSAVLKRGRRNGAEVVEGRFEVPQHFRRPVPEYRDFRPA